MSIFIILSSITLWKPLKILYPTTVAAMSLWIIQTTSPNTLWVTNSWSEMDSSSIILLSLSLLTASLILLSSFSPTKSSTLVLLILLALIPTFSMNDIISFYVFFELSLIPTFLLINSQGKQPERLQASLYLLLYTIFASLPLLLGIITSTNSSFSLLLYQNSQLSLAPLFMIAFLVKLPMFLFHLWLPKAHVEAPLEGSMILAAILLKLGGYGLIRFIPLMIKQMTNLSPWMMSISLLGAFTTSMNCIRQKDLKALIAYSSVAHMALVICALFSMKTKSTAAAMLMMISHGLSSAALFFLATILYQLHHTRNTLAFKGTLIIIPNLTLWWFLASATNISAPPTSNFISEILIMMNTLNWNNTTTLPLFIAALATASFVFVLYSNLTHTTAPFNPSSAPSPKTHLSLLCHLFPLTSMFWAPELLF